MLYIILYILYSNYTITSRAVPDPSVNPVEDPNVVEEIIEENKKVTNLDGTVTKYHTETRRSVTPSVAEQNAIASSLKSVHQSKRPSEIIGKSWG